MNRLRWALFCILLGLLVASSSAQDEVKAKKKIPPRFGYPVDEMYYPQDSPKKAMKSIAHALDRKKVNYLLAHLTDPAYVDYWVDRIKAGYSQGKEEAKILMAFDHLVRRTEQYFEDDSLLLKDLRIFANEKEADWEEKDDLAIGTVKTIPGRKVFLRRIDERWFLKNDQMEDTLKK
jgi:hypothetical protein